MVRFRLMVKVCAELLHTDDRPTEPERVIIVITGKQNRCGVIWLLQPLPTAMVNHATRGRTRRKGCWCVNGKTEPPKSDGARTVTTAQAPQTQTLSARNSSARTASARTSEQQIDAVSASLRRAYSDAVAEQVPDALMDLLNKLR